MYIYLYSKCCCWFRSARCADFHWPPPTPPGLRAQCTQRKRGREKGCTAAQPSLRAGDPTFSIVFTIGSGSVDGTDVRVTPKTFLSLQIKAALSVYCWQAVSWTHGAHTKGRSPVNNDKSMYFRNLWIMGKILTNFETKTLLRKKGLHTQQPTLHKYGTCEHCEHVEGSVTNANVYTYCQLPKHSYTGQKVLRT